MLEELTQEQIADLCDKAQSIELKPVISSNIGGIGYDPINKLLKVAFRSKTCSNIYIYNNVEETTYNDLFMAESIGKKLNESVVRHKDKYQYFKL